jgi:hypothetical protein
LTSAPFSPYGTDAIHERAAVALLIPNCCGPVQRAWVTRGALQ